MHPDEPAFPEHGEIGAYREGMSIRTWMFGQALKGVTANPNWAGHSPKEIVDRAIEIAEHGLSRLMAMEGA